MRTNIIVLSFIIILGISYGLISADRNQFRESPGITEFSEPYWEPSPIWFPSYLLHKAAKVEIEVGISHCVSGYYFTSKRGKYIYYSVSSITGGLIFAVFGFLLIRLKKEKLV